MFNKSLRVGERFQNKESKKNTINESIDNV